MIGYYFGLALRSLRRAPVMTALMVLAIGLGIGASMTMVTVLHVMTGDPLPARSARLFHPRLDPLPESYGVRAGAPNPADDFTWVDAMALLRAHRAVRQAAMAGGLLLVRPQRAELHPFYATGRYATADFFAMFGVPLMQGHAWSAADDQAHARVVVLGRELARKLFGGEGGVGRTVRMGDADYRVVGVAGDWRPRPQFYADSAGKLYSDADEFFLPLATAAELNLAVTGNQSGWGKAEGDRARYSDNLSWLQVWVQLDTPAQVAAYRRFLADYAAQQKAPGRFEKKPESAARLYGLMDWLAYENLVPADLRMQLWLALGFLFVCMVNIVALLLAKFLRRSGEISVRRALGARRRDIFAQLGLESVAIGLAGGVLGLLIAQLGLWSVRHRPDDYAQLASMDVAMLTSTFALAVTASALAGLLPAWRACRVAPALQLKTL